MALAVGTAQPWHTASPSLPALALLSGSSWAVTPIKCDTTCPSPAHPLAQRSTGGGRARASQPLLGATAPLGTAMPPPAMGTWVYKGGTNPRCGGTADGGRGHGHGCTHAHRNMDTPLDGPSRCGHTDRDRRMDSWMLRLAAPPPQCLGTARGGPKPVLGDKAL